MKKSLRMALMAVTLSGCSSTQLNYNTLDIASSADKLLTIQVLYNLGRFLDDPVAIPSQLVVASGGTSTTNSLTPSITTPVDSVSAATSQFTRAVAAVTTTTAQQTSVVTRNPASLSVAASDLWSQNYNFVPVVDTFQLRRLRALYSFAINGRPEKLLERYPLLYKSVTMTRPACLVDAVTGQPIIVTVQTGILKRDGKALDESWEPPAPRGRGSPQPKAGEPMPTPSPGASGSTEQEQSNAALEKSSKQKYLHFNTCVAVPKPTAISDNQVQTVNGGQDAFSVMVPDEFYLRPPACVLCLIDPRRDFIYGNLMPNPKLKSGWLRWRCATPQCNREDFPPSQGDVPLGRFGNYDLFVACDAADDFVEFTLFVQAAATQTDSTTSQTVTSAASAKATRGNTPGALLDATTGQVATIVQQ